MYIVGDIGGTKTRLALADRYGLRSEPVIYPTPKMYEEGMRKMSDEMHKLMRHGTVHSVVVGIAGSLNKEKTALHNAPNLPHWNNKPLLRRIALETDASAYIENDTALAALGEAIYGAGKGKKIVAYLTISTGVGGARVVNGRLDEAAYNFEPGHQIINDSHAKDLESYIGGAAMYKRFGRKSSDITDERVWDGVEKYLSYGILNTLVYWSPDIVVLGGGAILHKKIKPDRLKVRLKKLVKIYQEVPPIVSNSLGDFAALYGGIVYMNGGS